MPNNLGFRSGQVLLQKFRVEAATVIEPGDMVYLDETVIRPASDVSWDTNLATTQQEFADMFLGIAHGQSANGDETPVSIDVSSTSIYEFDVTPGAYDNGNTLGPEEGSSQLLNQQLAYAGSASQSIARATEYAETMVSRLRVTFASAFTTSTTNSNAAIG